MTSEDEFTLLRRKKVSRHWFREMLRQRFREGLPVAASVLRYLPYSPPALFSRWGRVHASRQRMINETATEFGATLIYGPRGGMWSAVYVMPYTELTEELQLRALGEQVAPGHRRHNLVSFSPLNCHSQRNWYIRHWRGKPFLCIRIPREKRWYDIYGYLVQ